MRNEGDSAVSNFIGQLILSTCSKVNVREFCLSKQCVGVFGRQIMFI